MILPAITPLRFAPPVNISNSPRSLVRPDAERDASDLGTKDTVTSAAGTPSSVTIPRTLSTGIPLRLQPVIINATKIANDKGDWYSHLY
jgi:hypothetical protein